MLTQRLPFPSWQRGTRSWCFWAVFPSHSTQESRVAHDATAPVGMLLCSESKFLCKLFPSHLPTRVPTTLPQNLPLQTAAFYITWVSPNGLISRLCLGHSRLSKKVSSSLLLTLWLCRSPCLWFIQIQRPKPGFEMCWTFSAPVKVLHRFSWI